jgi:hypothetical protein
MEGFGFRLVCAICLTTRGVLDSEALPEQCPDCGARESWTGPFAVPFAVPFARERSEQLTESPFYLAASGAPHGGLGES